jgi:enoyl-CoA hydratase/carnithine racemase
MIAVNRHINFVELSINRPEKKNALTSSMYAQLAAEINNANENMHYKAILLTGGHSFFTAGNDLADFMSNPNMDESTPVFHFLNALIESELPIIAAVEGFAVGVGTTMLLHCDQVFAGRSASFSMPFINLGLVPEACASLLLPRQVGYQQAANWLMTGDTFSADEACQAGLVAQLVSDGEADAQAQAFVEKLAQKPRSALIATKRLLRRPEETLQARLHAELELFIEGLNGPAAKEAMTAFMEKRPANFSDF